MESKDQSPVNPPPAEPNWNRGCALGAAVAIGIIAAWFAFLYWLGGGMLIAYSFAAMAGAAFVAGIRR